MKGFREPSFQDRAATSARSKLGQLEKLKSAPKLSEEQLAERAARNAERDAKAAAKSAANRQARADAQRLKVESRAPAEKAKAEKSSRTEAELKAARDARYAARKNRK